MASLLVVLPSYDGRRGNARAMAQLLGIRNLDVRTMEIQDSLLAKGFNTGWATALNAEPDFFMMLHEDIIPVDEDWAKTLFQEFTDRRASILSVVSPIKTSHGLTSTAVETDDPWKPRRYTLDEIYQLPETWTEPGLLVNTGMMLVNFSEPWVSKVHFHIDDRIIQEDGRWVEQVMPEDWNFSRDAASHGARVYATRKVAIQHVGRMAYPNYEIWGTEKTDPLHAQEIVAV